MGNSGIDIDSAVRMMKTTLESFYNCRAKDGEEKADGLRMQFAGAKFMLEAVGGRVAVGTALTRLRATGLKIPHCGERAPDGSYFGMDSDADLDF
jgi:hypothetical protein